MTASSLLPGFRAPAAGFDDPMALLHACHERVQRSLDLLQRLRAHVETAGADAAARDAARDVLRYFDIAAPLHHEDEERHVFPRLQAQAGRPDLARLVDRLQSDHRHMANEWAAARVPLSALANGSLVAFGAADSAVLDAFAGRYADHMAAEEGLAYPAVLQGLSGDAGAAERAAMGREMAQRRGAPSAQE